MSSSVSHLERQLVFKNLGVKVDPFDTRFAWVLQIVDDNHIQLTMECNIENQTCTPKGRLTVKYTQREIDGDIPQAHAWSIGEVSSILETAPDAFNKDSPGGARQIGSWIIDLEELLFEVVDNSEE